MPLIGVAVKPFSVAKRRLGLPASVRSRLGKAIAAHTVAVASSVATTVVVTDSQDVVRWARRLGVDAVVQTVPGLSGAGQALIAAAAGQAWLMIHADLPLVTVPDFQALIDALERRSTVLAPSYDGGTPAIGTVGAFRFAYGLGSFRRHFAQAPDAAIVVRRGLALDLDRIDDLRIAVAQSPGLSEFLA